MSRRKNLDYKVTQQRKQLRQQHLNNNPTFAYRIPLTPHTSNHPKRSVTTRQPNTKGHSTFPYFTKINIALDTRRKSDFRSIKSGNSASENSRQNKGKWNQWACAMLWRFRASITWKLYVMLWREGNFVREGVGWQLDVFVHSYKSVKKSFCFYMKCK